MKFLIDECLTVQLVAVANSRGHLATHVVHVGLSGRRDREIAKYAFDNDYVVVTNDAADFRKLLGAVDLHPGLAIIVPSALLTDQIAMFERFLDDLASCKLELVNMAVEIDRTSIKYFPLP